MSQAPLLEAPVTLLPLPRPLMAGEVLDSAFRLFRAGLLRTLPYSGLAVLVLELPVLVSSVFGGSVGSGVGSLVVYGCALLLSVLLLGVITLRLHAVSQGVRPRFRREIGAALRRWPAAILATTAALGFPLTLFVVYTAVNSYLALPLLFVLAVPLLWPTSLFVVALPAFWCDGLGPLAAIARAVRISRRRTWRVAGAIVATTGMVLVFYVLTLILTALVGAVVGGADLLLMSIVRSMLALVLGAFGVPFVLSMLIVANEDLKLREAERVAVRA